jgi:hypothetical protein
MKAADSQFTRVLAALGRSLELAVVNPETLDAIAGNNGITETNAECNALADRQIATKAHRRLHGGCCRIGRRSSGDQEPAADLTRRDFRSTKLSNLSDQRRPAPSCADPRSR